MEIVVGEVEVPAIAPVRRPRAAPRRSAQRATVTVEEDGSTVAVRVPAGAQSLSEPIHRNGGVRLYLTLPGTSMPVLPDVAGGRGLIGLKLEEGDNALRLAVDASSLTGYRLETGENGSTLWLETAPAPLTTIVAATESAATDDGANTTIAAAAAASPAASDPRPVLNEHIATATDGRAVTRSPANGFAIGARATGELAWNGIRAAVGRTAAVTMSAAKGIGGSVARSTDRIAAALEERGLNAPRPEIVGALIGLLVATIVAWLSLRKRATHSPARTVATRDEMSASAVTAPGSTRPAPNVGTKSSPAMNGSPAIWAARTMAGNGMDAASIARRTGIARDAAALLVAASRRNLPDPAASSPSLLAAVAAGPVPVEAII
jgi:hypothetical protein